MDRLSDLIRRAPTAPIAVRAASAVCGAQQERQPRQLYRRASALVGQRARSGPRPHPDEGRSWRERPGRRAESRIGWRRRLPRSAPPGRRLGSPCRTRRAPSTAARPADRSGSRRCRLLVRPREGNPAVALGADRHSIRDRAPPSRRPKRSPTPRPKPKPCCLAIWSTRWPRPSTPRCWTSATAATTTRRHLSRVELRRSRARARRWRRSTRTSAAPWMILPRSARRYRTRSGFCIRARPRI